MNSLFLIARNRKNIQRTMLGLIVVLSLMMGSSLPAAQAQEGSAPELFSDAGAADQADGNPAVVRSRFVNVNLGLLLAPTGQALDASANREVTLNLFPDATYTGVVESVEPNYSGGKSWTGRLKEAEGIFYLVNTPGAFIAHVVSMKGTYEVSLAGENLYKVIQIDQSKLVDDAPGLVDHPDPIVLDPELDVAADAASTIDVMVVYTTAARVAEGGTAAMWARINLAMKETKDIYSNAGVDPDLRLVNATEITYQESGNLLLDKSRLVNPSDGYLDNVQRLRNIYGADMVSLVVNTGNACGIAGDILASAGTAFQVTKRVNCMTGYYSFAHEFGHLQGARHDLYVDPNTTPFAYGHGHVNLNQRWRTVMAYNDKCRHFGFDCLRLPFFSNPNKTHTGAVTGVEGTSENYRVLNETALTVANFRQAKIGKNFVSTFNASVGPWKAVTGTWTLGSDSSAAYISSPGVANSYASIQYPRAYGDLTAQARLLRTEPAGCNTATEENCWSGLFIRGNPASLGTQKWWQPSYEFDYSNDGYFAIFRNNANGSFNILKTWTFTTAIHQGDWNTLKVVAVGKSLRFYINGVLVSTVNDPSFRIGRVGVQFYTAASTAGNRLYVDWVKVANTPTGGIAYDQLTDEAALPVESGPRNRKP